MNESQPTHSITDSLPPPVPWAPAAVRLLQGIVYHDDPGGVWESILAGLTPLSDYFARIGLLLVVSEEDGLAYLRQIDSEELPPEYQGIPRLFRTARMGFEASLLCVVLRDELRRFEEEIHDDRRCVIAQSDLLASWQTLITDEADEVRLNRALSGQLKKLEEMKFVRQFEKEPPTWEVRRILKARLPLSELETLKSSLESELLRRAGQGHIADG